jgi:hypothetical protein
LGKENRKKTEIFVAEKSALRMGAGRGKPVEQTNTLDRYFKKVQRQVRVAGAGCRCLRRKCGTKCGCACADVG